MPRQVKFSEMHRRHQNKILLRRMLEDSAEYEDGETENTEQATGTNEADACTRSKRFCATNSKFSCENAPNSGDGDDDFSNVELSLNSLPPSIGAAPRENLEYSEFSSEVQFNSSAISMDVDDDSVIQVDDRIDFLNDKRSLLNESIEYLNDMKNSFALEATNECGDSCHCDSAIDLDDYYERETIEDHIVADVTAEGDGKSKVVEPESGEFSFEKFKEALTAWAIFNIVNATHIDSLLDLLKTVPGLEELPSTSKTLKKTPFNTSKEIQQLEDGGLYYHFGLKKCLLEILPSFVKDVVEIKLLLNADGVSMSKSGGSEIWNILCTVQNIEALKEEVMPVGFYHAAKKPKDARFMEALVKELCDLVHDGIIVDGKKISVYIEGFCCDAPARSLILGTINFNGLKSCTRCHATGKKSNNRTHFPTKIDEKTRTNDEYLEWTDKKFRKKETPVSKVPGINFPRAFSLDSMHLVYHGVLKTLLALTFLVPKQPHKLAARAKNTISAKIQQIRDFAPVEFARKPRVLDFLSFFKATEFRFWLLYSGPLLLKKDLSENKYLNFLSLHVAMRILSSPACLKDSEMISYAQKLLEFFVESFAKLYGSHYVTYNFHALLHLSEDVEFFGSLIDCSAFKFENYNMFIISLIKKKSYVLAQIANRLTERLKAGILFKKRVSSQEPEFIGKKNNHSGGVIKYDKVKFNNITLSTSQPDHCCQLKDGSIVCISDIHYDTLTKEHYLMGHYYLSKGDFYVRPCRSSLIDVYEVSNLSNTKKRFALSDVKHKCVLLPKNDEGTAEMVSFPMLH